MASLLSDLGPIALDDPALAWLAAAGFLAALVRGFSGFGAAMIFMPIATLVVPPTTAAVLLFLADNAISLPLFLRALGRCVWRETLPLTLGASLTVPLGVALLVRLDPVVIRWLLSLLILAAVAALATGWRRRAAASVPASFGIGGLSGLAGGMANLYGPPIVLFWLGGQDQASTVRANILVFFGLISVMAALSYWQAGLFEAARFVQAGLLIPAYGLGLLCGARLFGRASEGQFRAVALGLCGLVALVTLPLWERL